MERSNLALDDFCEGEVQLMHKSGCRKCYKWHFNVQMKEEPDDDCVREDTPVLCNWNNLPGEKAVRRTRTRQFMSDVLTLLSLSLFNLQLFLNTSFLERPLIQFEAPSNAIANHTCNFRWETSAKTGKAKEKQSNLTLQDRLKGPESSERINFLFHLHCSSPSFGRLFICFYTRVTLLFMLFMLLFASRFKVAQCH